MQIDFAPDKTHYPFEPKWFGGPAVNSTRAVADSAAQRVHLHHASISGDSDGARRLQDLPGRSADTGSAS